MWDNMQPINFTIFNDQTFHSMSRSNQGCGLGVVRRRRLLGGVGVGFLTTLVVGVGFSCPTPTPDDQLDYFLHHTPNLGIPVEMVQFILKFSLKQRCFAVHHGFH